LKDYKLIDNLVANIALSGQWVVGSLLRFGSFAAFTSQATHHPPPQVRFR